jgi:hypothetical protein
MRPGKRFVLGSVFLVCAIGLAFGGHWLVGNVAVLPGFRGCAYLHDAYGKREACVADRTTAIAKEDGLKSALTKVGAYASKDARIELVCHRAMHTVARNLNRPLNRYGTADLKAVNSVDSDCATGYIHEVVALTVNNGDATDLKTVASICSNVKIDGANDADAGSWCFHGLGHGIRRQTDDWVEMVKLCRTYSPTGRPYGSCLGGGFMEESFKRATSHSKTDDLARLCSKVTGKVERKVCWQYAPIRGRDGR